MPHIDPDKQREFATEVVRRLRAQQFEALWAGGCVRDQLLGRAVKDFDVATSATPEQVRELFGMRRTLAIGAAFGVIVVLGPNGAGQVETATFRQDVAYSDGRRPDAVEFSTPEADALRRDFTINGLFYDPLEDRVIDYVGGRRDLEARVLRAIGEPRERFTEDKLRLLRAVRFASTLDFALDAPTRQAVEAMAAQVTTVSAERIADEMRRMLTHPRRGPAMALLADVGLLAVIVPELAAVAPPADEPAVDGATADAWRETIRVLDHLGEANFELALAGLLYRFVEPAQVDHLARRWKLSNRERLRAHWLVAHQRALAGARQMPWSQLQPLLIAEGILELLALVEAIEEARGAASDEVAYCRELLQMPPAALDPPQLLTGDDLIAHGVPRGKAYQQILAAVRAAQLDGQVDTTAQALELVDRLRPKE